MSQQPYQHLNITRDGQGVLTITIDVKGQSQNVFSEDVVEEMASLLRTLSSDTTAKVIVFRSGKPGSFFAGANIKEIEAIKSAAEAEEKSRVGQELFAAVEKLRQPTVAVIEGICLGGGLEFAMSCGHRIACENGSTRLGLPEVELGILPAWGGTVRLPRLVGLVPAFQIMLQGKKLSATEAEKLGLVDVSETAEGLESRVNAFAQDLIGLSGGTVSQSKKRSQSWSGWFLNETAIGRSMVFSQTAKRVAKQSRDYPAVLEVLNAVKAGYQQSREAGFEAERKSLGKLLFSRTCRSLIGLYFQRERARSGQDWVQGAPTNMAVTHLAVIGGGVMGGGIAQLAAQRGYQVTVKEANEEFARKTREQIEKTLADLVQKRRMTESDRTGLLKLITVSSDWDCVKTADLAIEAVPEKLELKREVFGELSRRLPATAVLASNTSALSIDDFAAAVSDPSRLAGMHFFNPVHRMPLVEIVRSEGTSVETLGVLLGVTKRLGKVPVVVKNSPGFLVNRVLMPYLDEGVRLLCEGHVSSEIDRELRKFGMPMGPIELLDQIGLDVGLHVAKTMEPYFGGESPTVGVLTKLVQLKRLGKKTGRGFYSYEKGDYPIPIDLTDVLMGFDGHDAHAPGEEHHLGASTMSGGELDSEITQRTILALVNETVRCLDEGIVEAAWMADLAMVLGTGYAPFRGGPLKTADDLGIKKVVQTLKELSTKAGPRFMPAQGLIDRERGGKGFYV